MLGRDEVTERRACRVLGQARNTQRRKASVADDEPRLVKRIVPLILGRLPAHLNLMQAVLGRLPAAE